MRPVKNLFSGSLGKLQNIGCSKFFTTPHTVLVPVDYQINSGSQGEFIACSLDGRLWLFSDKLTALKWNANTSRMEFAKSLQINVESFIARGIDWILTGNSFFQVLDDAPYIFSESVSFNESLNVDAFYSFLPAIDGWQIIKNFLVRRYNNEADSALQSLSIPANLYLTHLEQTIYGKNSSNIGVVSIEDNTLVISPDYSSVQNVSGLAVLDKSLYGFKLKQDTSLCLVSADSLLYSLDNASWSNVFSSEETTGNIFFDPFNYSALAVRDDAVNLLPEKKIFTAKGISQWVAPTRNIASVTSDFVIAQLEHDILATHVNSGLYREILHQKNLALTCRGYSDYKLAIGESNNVLRLNKIVYKKSTLPNIELINILSTTYCISFINIKINDISGGFYFENPIPMFEISSARKYKVKVFKYGEQTIDVWGNSDVVTGDIYYEESSSIPKSYYDEDGYYHPAIYCIEQFDTKLAYINPVTGELSVIDVSVIPPNKINFKTVSDYTDVWTSGGGRVRVYYSYLDIDSETSELMQNFHADDFYLYEDKIYCKGFFTDGYWHTRDIYIPVADIPDNIKSYIPNVETNYKSQIRLLLDHFYFQNEKVINGRYDWYSYIENPIQSPINACFRDTSTQTFYNLDFFSAIQDFFIYAHDYRIKVLTFPDWNNLNSSCITALHIINFYEDLNTPENCPDRLLIFRSEIFT